MTKFTDISPLYGIFSPWKSDSRLFSWLPSNKSVNITLSAFVPLLYYFELFIESEQKRAAQKRDSHQVEKAKMGEEPHQRLPREKINQKNSCCCEYFEYITKDMRNVFFL